MIKINLLPAERQKKEFPVWKVYRLLAYIFLGLTLVLWGYNLGMYKYQRAKLTEVDGQIAQIKVWQDRYNKVQAENADIRKRDGIVAALAKQRLSWSHFVAELGNVTPKGCWLDSIKEAKTKTGETLTIKGGAMSMDVILDYTGQLQSLPNVTSLQIADTAQAKKNNTAYLNYTIVLQRSGVTPK